MTLVFLEYFDGNYGKYQQTKDTKYKRCDSASKIDRLSLEYYRVKIDQKTEDYCQVFFKHETEEVRQVKFVETPSSCPLYMLPIVKVNQH